MHQIGPILLVEDNDADVLAVQRAFEELGISNPVVNVVNGEDALLYLQRPNNPWPVYIILDLEMPRMNGFEFLEIVKADETLKTIPVIILTSSNQKIDIQRGYELGAAGYIVKSADYQDFIKVIKVMNRYWNLSRLPTLEFWPSTI